MANLNWTRNGFDKFDLVLLASPGDGGCFFHSILNGFFIPYRTGINDGYPVTKQALVTKFRDELADYLAKPTDPLNSKSPSVWSTLGQGNLVSLSKEDPSYSLASMQNRLRTSSEVGNEFLELVGDVIKHDIYILSSETQDLYWMGDEFGLIYKGRPSIVLLYNGTNHYDLLGLYQDDKISTRFSVNNDFIAFLRQRQLDQLVPKGSTNKAIVHDLLFA